MDDALREQTEAVLREIDPTISVGTRSDAEGTFLDLPYPPNADYRFSLYLGEPQIHAALVGSPRSAHFWYWPFEEPDYASASDQRKHFMDSVQLVLRHPTRITQTRGWFGSVFRCEAVTPDGFVPIGGSLSLWFRIPKIAERERVYHSPPVIE